MFATSRGLFIGLAFLVLCGIVRASGPSALGASGPAREYADKLMFFGQFVGNWEFDMTATKPDGSQVTGKGEWYFGWVLDGRALRDVWIFPGAGQPRPRGSWEYGSSVRFYDPKEDVWRLSWIGPVRTNMGILPDAWWVTNLYSRAKIGMATWPIGSTTICMPITFRGGPRFQRTAAKPGSSYSI